MLDCSVGFLFGSTSLSLPSLVAYITYARNGTTWNIHSHNSYTQAHHTTQHTEKERERGKENRLQSMWRRRDEKWMKVMMADLISCVWFVRRHSHELSAISASMERWKAQKKEKKRRRNERNAATECQSVRSFVWMLRLLLLHQTQGVDNDVYWLFLFGSRRSREQRRTKKKYSEPNRSPKTHATTPGVFRWSCILFIIFWELGWTSWWEYISTSRPHTQNT